ncbi:MAG: PqqD family protein [Ruminococcaceae bacterium]|nr:PqqD family protein [Oscillospiraceae bacterium]
MKINPDFTIQQVGGYYVAVPIGETSKHFHAMLRLNETGAFLWKLMAEKDISEEELVEALLAEYEVSREMAAADVHRLVESMREAQLFV